MTLLLRRTLGRKRGKWNTGPERNFNEYQKSRKLGLIQNVKWHPPTFGAAGTEQTVFFQLDFARPLDYEIYAATGFHNPQNGFDVDFEIDGPMHDWATDRAKNMAKNSFGLKVIHIPSALCDRKSWARLDSQIRKALATKEMTVYIQPKRLVGVRSPLSKPNP